MSIVVIRIPEKAKGIWRGWTGQGISCQMSCATNAFTIYWLWHPQSQAGGLPCSQGAAGGNRPQQPEHNLGPCPSWPQHSWNHIAYRTRSRKWLASFMLETTTRNTGLIRSFTTIENCPYCPKIRPYELLISGAFGFSGSEQFWFPWSAAHIPAIPSLAAAGPFFRRSTPCGGTKNSNTLGIVALDMSSHKPNAFWNSCPLSRALIANEKLIMSSWTCEFSIVFSKCIACCQLPAALMELSAELKQTIFGLAAAASIASSKSRDSHHWPLWSKDAMAAEKLTTVGCASHLGIKSNNRKIAWRHCLPTPHAVIAALKLITSGWIPLQVNTSKSIKASCQCPPFWQQLMPALNVMTSDLTLASGMASNIAMACSHAPPLWHALMAALKLTTSGWTRDIISPKRLNAFCHCPALSHELIRAPKVTTLGATSAQDMVPNKLNACCHWLAFSHALMAALKQTTSLGMDAVDIAWNKRRACCHCWPFSHELIAALKVMTSTWILPLAIAWHKLNAFSHCPDFSHELMVALKLTASGKILASGIAPSKLTACSQSPARLQALMEEL